MTFGDELFTDPFRDRIIRVLPTLFNMVELENRRGKRLGMEVGTAQGARAHPPYSCTFMDLTRLSSHPVLHRNWMYWLTATPFLLRQNPRAGLPVSN